jgi:twitching motility protein PilT
MKTWSMEGEMRDKVETAMHQSPWFNALDDAHLEKVLALGKLMSFEPDENIVRAGDPADSFFLLLRGEISIEATRASGDTVELGRVRPPFSFGEVGLLLGKQRTATVIALEEVYVLSFEEEVFRNMFDGIPGFRLNVARTMASRLDDVSELVLPRYRREDGIPDADVLDLLPLSFIQKHRVLPISIAENLLTLGFVGDPDPPALAGVRQHLPGIEINPVRVSAALFHEALSTVLDHSETKILGPAVVVAPAKTTLPDRLRSLLERVVAQGASDLHLSPGKRPAWRIDGDILVMEDAEPLGDAEVHDLIDPLLEERHRKEFAEHRDVDLSASIEGLGRFRINLYTSNRGVGAALRQIPWQIQTLEKLGLPGVLKKFCAEPKGLVLVTGPTGSGKSTTLAAMIDYINRVRRCHILTLEDPIEFIHDDNQSLLDQREIGGHAESYARGLRAALREDPDVVLLGEIRVAEEAALALEIANTGHLVFSTLHTNSAISSVERVVDLFPPQSQGQARASLADNLRGVVSQTLCKARHGGRVAAVEVLVGGTAVANLIREGKPNQLANIMQTGGKEGNRLLNDDLARLVLQRKVLRDEALSKSIDKKDLMIRLQKDPAQADLDEARLRSS